MSSRGAARSRAPRRPGRRAAGRACPASGAFEASTPAEAQTKPWRVSAITNGARVRTIRAASRRITSSCRGSASPASSRACAEGSTSSSAHDASLGLGHRLLRDDDDVAVLERRARRRDQRAEVVARPISGSPSTGRSRSGQAGEAHAGVGAVARFTFTMTAVIPSSARALASGPASIARPPTSRPASSSASSFAPRRRRRRRRPRREARAGEVDRRERCEARRRRAPRAPPRRARRASAPRAGLDAVLGEAELARDAEERRRRRSRPRARARWRARPGSRRGRRGPRPRRRRRSRPLRAELAPPPAPARRRASRSDLLAGARAAPRARGRIPGAAEDRDLQAGPPLPSAASASAAPRRGVPHQRPGDDRAAPRPVGVAASASSTTSASIRPS